MAVVPGNRSSRGRRSKEVAEMPKRALAAALAASFVFLIGASPAQASPVRVKIVNYAFKPAKVSVSKGTKVVWKNASTGTSHTVTSYKGPWSKNTVVAAGSTTSFTFNGTGTFKYYCSFHAHITLSGACVANTGIPTRMCGTVVVT
jgi:plastocyanin